MSSLKKHLSDTAPNAIKAIRDANNNMDDATFDAALADLSEAVAALERIAAKVYEDRETVSAANAWPAFKRSNATVCWMADTAKAALAKVKR